MKDEEKSKEKLLNELREMRKRVAEIERLDNQKETWLRSLLDSLPISIYIVQNGKFKFVNPQFEKISGYQEDELVDRDSLMIVHPEDRNLVRENTIRMLKGELVSPFEFKAINKRGEFVWIATTLSSINYQGKQAILGNFIDITKQKEAERELRRSQKELQQFFDQLFTLIAKLDVDGTLLMANQTAIKTTGLSYEEVIGQPFTEVYSWSYDPEVQQRLKKAIEKAAKGETVIYEEKIRVVGGFITIQFCLRPVFDEAGKVLYLIAEGQDITLIKEKEKELRESHELIDSISNFAGISDREGILRLINRKALEDLGFESDEVIGKPLWEIGWFKPSPETVEKLKSSVKKALQGERNRVEIKVFSKTGKEILVYHTSTPIYDETGQVTGVALEGVDISELKEKEKVLVEEKERLSVTLRSIGDGVICTNREGIVVLINKVAEKLTGWKEKEAIGRPVSEVFHIVNEKTRERCENPVERVLETGGVVGLANNTVLIAKDGTERILADSGAPIRDREGKIIGVVLVFRDITEKRVIEEELQKMEKLESIGILAGGIAHDFNNLLMGILGNVGLAKIYMRTEEPDVMEKLTDAEKACFRAKELTQQLLVFSKGGAPIKKLTSISELIIDTVTFVLRGSNVRCEFSIPEDLWPVEIDEGQMSQVISNLVINADQAMPKGGIIQVRAENIVMEKLPSLTLRPGRYIKITIEDNGIGIPREYLSKIFDPYFSTKQTGSGLGLATAYSVIKRHDGDIRVESELGVGTTFYIYLPASEKPFPAKEEKEERILTGSGKILIMDDEMIVRKVTGEMLTYIGYKVEYARDGAEAIEIYKREKEKGEPFDAVILDLTVAGGMGGKEAIEKLLEIDPKVRAIVSSGYSNDPIMANFREYGFRAMVVKPYKIKVLSKAVREAMKD